MHIIIIDDNAEFCAVTAELLERAGHVVRQTDNAREGFRLLRESPADLAIIDIILPTDDGLELMMKVQRAFPHVAVIAISGASAYSALYLKFAAKLGAVAVLLKPFAMDELSAAIARLVSAPGAQKPA